MLFLTGTLLAQTIEDEEEEDNRPPRPDLPFEIKKSKRLTERDEKNKKEGGYFTGLPLLNSDPNVGIGYGARVLYFENGTREDPFFEYTPYRYRIFAQYFNTTRQAPYHWLSLDAPYIFDTQWRVRGDLIYSRNPNLLYFGIGEETLKPLRYRDRNDPRQPIVRNATFNDYEKALAYRRPGGAGEADFVTDRMYNRYDNQNPNIQLSAERSFFGGTVRLVGGTRLSRQIIRTNDGRTFQAKDPFFGETDFSFANIDVDTPNGRTKVTEDAEAGKIIGLEGGYVNTLRAGIVYDTRDFEPDPNSGWFLEATHEKSTKAIGSNYEFNRNHASARFFVSPFKRTFEKLVIAGRAAAVQTNGDAPFFEYNSFWGTETGQAGLGGRTTLRGFKQDRFIGPAMAYANLEVRWKFASIDAGSQHFDFQLVPFYDAGRVWDETRTMNLKDYKHSRGIGLRIPWNQATIIYIDYGVSDEDRQVFVNFNHIF
ncbi:MAG: BamA/TamA family outer membrane protein [Leptospira sp.]|nr:BamA/TamA family outer membrane protein [Leptospira sp.]